MIDPSAKKETNLTIRVSQDFKDRLARAAADDRRATSDWVRLALERAVEYAELDDERHDIPHERVMEESRARGMITPEAEQAVSLTDEDFTRAQEHYDRRERWW